jgi:hypothetical protein
LTALALAACGNPTGQGVVDVKVAARDGRTQDAARMDAPALDTRHPDVTRVDSGPEAHVDAALCVARGDAGATPWAPETLSAGGSLNAVFGSGPNDVYAAGDNGVFVHSAGGGVFSPVTDVNAPTGRLLGIFAPAGSSDLYVSASSGAIWLRSAGVWQSAVPIPGYFRDYYGVWGTSSTDVYGVGDALAIVRSGGGGAWARISYTFGPGLFSVWGSGPSNIYVVGASGTVYQGAGTRFTQQSQSITTADLNGVWGTGPADIYVVGNGGTILHLGSSGAFMPESSGTMENLLGVWGGGPCDVYAVGAAGTILHSAGDGSWSQEPSGTTADLRSVWGSGSGDVYVVGLLGTILHRA